MVAERPRAEDVFDEEDRKRLAELYRKLDVNKNGLISIDELKKHISAESKDRVNERTKHIMKNSEQITLNQFVDYVQSAETTLKLAFKQMDRNQDKQIDVDEIMATFEELGVKVPKEYAKKLIQKVDKDGSLTLSYDEWRDFLLLSGSKSLKDMLTYIKKSEKFDIGEFSYTVPEFTDEERKQSKPLKTLIAGGVAGAVSRTFTAPLDRVKTIWQARGIEASSKGIFNSLSIMLKEGGYSSLWRGNFINCLKIGPESALRFLFYEEYKKLLLNRESRTSFSPEVTIGEKFVAGACAGATSQSIIYPMEVIKTRMCIRSTGEYSSSFDCIRNLYREYGWRVFYRGYVPNMLGILPYAGIDFAMYETFQKGLKNIFHNQLKDNPNASSYVAVMAGPMSSICAQIFTYPLALVKTRLQASKEKNKIGISQLLGGIVKKEGFSGLYRGIGPNMLKVLPAVSISYSTYEFTKKKLKDYDL